MPLVPAICPQCGGTVDIDAQTKTGFCKFCGTLFIVEKNVNNYFVLSERCKPITNQYAEEKIIKDNKDVIRLLNLATNAMQEEYEKALNYYKEILDIDFSRDDIRFNIAICDGRIKGVRKFSTLLFESAFSNALSLYKQTSWIKFYWIP